jgi:hypothetical protein
MLYSYLNVRILRIYFLCYIMFFLVTLGSFCIDEQMLNAGAAPLYDLKLNTLLLIQRLRSGRIRTSLGPSVPFTTDPSIIQTNALAGASAGMRTAPKCTVSLSQRAGPITFLTPFFYVC